MARENELRLHSCNLTHVGFKDEMKACPTLANCLDPFTFAQVHSVLRILVSAYLGDRIDGADVNWKYHFLDNPLVYDVVIKLRQYSLIIYLDGVEMTLQFSDKQSAGVRLVPKPTIEDLRKLNAELGELMARPGATLDDDSVYNKRYALKNFLEVELFHRC